MATGGGAAYLQLTNSENYLGRAIEARNKRAADEEAAKKLADERERVRQQEAEQTAYETLSPPKEGFKATLSGFDSTDKIVSDYVMNTSQQYADWGRKGMEAYKRGDQAGVNEARMAQSNLMTNYNLLNEASSVLGERFEEFNELAPNVSPVDEEYMAEMQAYLNNDYRIINDENGKSHIELLLKNKAGEERYVKKSLQDFIKNEQPYMKFNLTDTDDGWVNRFAEAQQLDVRKTSEGLYTVDTTKWSPRNQAALEMEIDGITNNDRKMSSALYQATGRKKKTGFNETDISDVEDYLTTLVKGRVEDEDKKDFDSSKANYLLNSKKEAKKDKEKEDEIFHAERVQEDTSGTPAGLPVPTTGGAERTEGKKYVFRNGKGSNELKGIISDDEGANVLSATLIGGDVIVEARKTDKVSSTGGGVDLLQKEGKRTSSETETYRKKLTDTEMGRLALKLGLRNAKDLKDYLESRDIKSEESNEGSGELETIEWN